MSRRAACSRPRCPVCRKPITRRDRVARMPRRGWAHVTCAGITETERTRLWPS